MTEYRHSPVRDDLLLSALASVAAILALASVACGGLETDSLALAGSAGIARAKISEEGVRLLALVKPMPLYPAASIKNKASGVAVAEILVSQDGRMEQVNVLQAPDAGVRETLEVVLMKWEFTKVVPTGQSKGVPFSSKLTFYFDVENGKGVVRSPEEKADVRPDSGQGGAESGTAPTELDEAAFQELARDAASDAVVVLDIRDRDDFSRGHRDGAVNMPANEVLARAVHELPLSSHIVVDYCEALGPLCAWVGDELGRLGFSRVSLLSTGSES